MTTLIAILRTAFTIVVAATLTVVFATVVLVAAVLRVPRRPGGIYVTIPRIWSRAILWAAGVRVTLHGLEHVQGRGPFIFTSNHVSLFDIPCLVSSLPQHYFVAKSELFDIPVFGPGIRAVGTIPIERENQKSAFGSYNVAAERIRSGSSVVVFPEGTRGTSYPIRRFKKGPFVLAIKSGAPVIPVVIHGTIEILPRKALLIHPGTVDVNILAETPTAGLSYDDRNQLAETTHDAMAARMAQYGQAPVPAQQAPAPAPQPIPPAPQPTASSSTHIDTR